MAITCMDCGAKHGLSAVLTMDLTNGKYVCHACLEKKRNEKWIQDQKFKEASDKVMITTTNHIECHMVDQYLGIESVEFVIGTGFFSEVTTNWQDFFGSRSTAFEQKLQAGKQAAFEMLKGLAVRKGANAIIGIDLDYTEFSGNRIGLIINGTLVHVTRTTRLTATKGGVAGKNPDG